MTCFIGPAAQSERDWPPLWSDDETAAMGEHQIILLGALLSDPPAAANGVVDIFPLVLIAPVYGDQNERLDDLERGDRILRDDLVDVAAPIVAGPMAGRPVQKARIGVYERRFDLKGDLGTLDVVPVHHMVDLKLCRLDLLDSLQLQIACVFLVLIPGASDRTSADVLEDAIAPARPDIERLAVSRVDQAIHIPPESLRHIVRYRSHGLSRSSSGFGFSRAIGEDRS